MTNIGPTAYHLHQQPGLHGYGSSAPGPSFPPSFPPQQYSQPQPQYSTQPQQAPPQQIYQQFRQPNLTYGNLQSQPNAHLGPSTSSGKLSNTRVEDHIPERVTLAATSLHPPICYTLSKQQADQLRTFSSPANLHFCAVQSACDFGECTLSDVPTWIGVLLRVWSSADSKHGSTHPTLVSQSNDAAATRDSQWRPGPTSTAPERSAESDPSLTTRKFAVAPVGCARKSACYRPSGY